MTSLTRGQTFEVVFWIGFAMVAYYFSFEFDQEIEIYLFGAAGWPRVVIALIALAAICQLIQDIVRQKHAKAEPTAKAPSGEAGIPQGERSAYKLRMAAVLVLPVVYGLVLDYSGFYVTTPFFIALYLYVTGERRVKWLIAVPIIIYLLLLLFFTKLLYVGLPVGYTSPFYEISNWLLVLLQ
jgi:hypothetical protein